MKTGFFLIAEIRKLYKAPDFVDKKSGEVTEGRDKVQVEYEEDLSNGETRLALKTLSCHDVQQLDALRGRTVMIPVGSIPNGKDVTYFIPKGSRIVPVDVAAKAAA
jgi:hypothetical protein